MFIQGCCICAIVRMYVSFFSNLCLCRCTGVLCVCVCACACACIHMNRQKEKDQMKWTCVLHIQMLTIQATHNTDWKLGIYCLQQRYPSDNQLLHTLWHAHAHIHIHTYKKTELYTGYIRYCSSEFNKEKNVIIYVRKLSVVVPIPCDSILLRTKLKGLKLQQQISFRFLLENGCTCRESARELKTLWANIDIQKVILGLNLVKHVVLQAKRNIPVYIYEIWTNAGLIRRWNPGYRFSHLSSKSTQGAEGR